MTYLRNNTFWIGVQPALTHEMLEFAASKIDIILRDVATPAAPVLEIARQTVSSYEPQVAEKTDLFISADAFIAARKLRNALVHEYMHDAQTFLESLFSARQACQMFFAVIERAEAEIVRPGVNG